MVIVRSLLAFAVLAVVAGYAVWSQDTPLDITAPDAAPTAGTPGTTPPTSSEGGATEVSSALQMANQAFQMLANRQFPAAKQLYQDAASSDSRYQRMVEFVDNIMTRAQDLFEESWELENKYNNPLRRGTTSENITRDDLEKMLDMQMRLQVAQGDLLGDFTLAELGLEDAKDADTVTLGEYLGWRLRKTTEFKIYDQMAKRLYERQMRNARIRFLMEQRQERARRREELQQFRFEVQGGGFSVGAGGMGGMGMGGYGGGGGGGMMGGFGGGMMGGGMMGGFGGGMMGGFD
jgi:hypothetical protein